MRKAIRLGDMTSHGGRVVSVRATHFRINGVPVACVGAICSCPIPGHNGCAIATGSARYRINGVAVAFEGDRTDCGAILRPRSETLGSCSTVCAGCFSAAC